MKHNTSAHGTKYLIYSKIFKIWYLDVVEKIYQKGMSWRDIGKLAMGPDLWLGSYL